MFYFRHRVWWPFEGFEAKLLSNLAAPCSVPGPNGTGSIGISIAEQAHRRLRRN